jgi:hypothetical protein
MDVNAVGAIVTAIGLIGLVVCLGVAHLLTDGLNPLRDPVSQYGITPRFRGLYAGAGESAAVAAIGAILVLVGRVGEGLDLTIVFLVIFAAARAIIPLVPMDAPDTRVTIVGRLHNVLAFAAFASITVAAFVAGGPLHDAGWTETAVWSTVFGVVMAIGSAGVLISRWVPFLHRNFGAVERVIYLGFILWFGMIVMLGLGR